MIMKVAQWQRCRRRSSSIRSIVSSPLLVRAAREGTIRTGPRMVLHGVFGKLLPKDQEVPVLAASITQDPRVEGMMVMGAACGFASRSVIGSRHLRSSDDARDHCWSRRVPQAYTPMRAQRAGLRGAVGGNQSRLPRRDPDF